MGKPKGQNVSAGLIVKGILAGVSVAFAGSGIVSVCINRGYIDFAACRYIAPVVWMIAAMVSSFVAGSRGDRASLFTTMLSAVSVNMLLFLIGLLMYDGMDIQMTWIGILVGLLGGGVGWILRYKQKNHTYRRKRRGRSC